MNYRTLGASGARVSEICLGAMTFGEADEKSFMHKVSMSEGDAHRVISAALGKGVNFWDTADVYGQDGLSERVIGNWFAKNKRRQDVVLATKCRFAMGVGPNDRGASRLHIKQALEASLKRLQTDYVDLYQIHMQDLQTPEEEVVRALDELVREGKVHYFGASNYAAYRLVEHLWIADRIHANRFVTLQAQYSLVERNLEYEHIPAMKKFGMGLLPWSPLGRGFLSGKYKRGQAAPAGTRMAEKKEMFASFDNDRCWAIVEALEEVARSVDATPAQVAVAWLLRQPTVSSVIVGVRTIEQLHENLKAQTVKLPDDAVERLNKLSQLPLHYPYDFISRIDRGW